MMQRRRISSEDVREKMLRANVLSVQTVVLLFQFAAMLLLGLKTTPPSVQALSFALILPAVTWALLYGLPKIWPIDRLLLLLVLFLCSVGLVTLQDIARAEITPRTHAVFIGIGLGAMIAGILFIRSLRRWEKWSKWWMLLTLLALASPLVIGKVVNGAKNWILFSVGGRAFSIQPSEFGKIALILVLAANFSVYTGLKSAWPTLLWAAACCGILLAERDLGAVVLYFLVTVGMFYAATSNVGLTLLALGAGAGGAVGAYYALDYVAKRVEVYLNPWVDPLDKGYQLVQALVAIGSGGLFGMGLGRGLPRNIPLYNSDFIFAAMSEEFGVLFAIGVLAVYALILARGITISRGARYSFHALAAFGVVIMLGWQTLVIVGGVVKLIPLTGVTMPFVSDGGSSMVAMLGGVGMLLGISSINAQDEGRELERLYRREGRL